MRTRAKRQQPSKRGTLAKRSARRGSNSAYRTARASDRLERSGSFPIVGVGASAGGLEAFGQLLSHIPAEPGVAFVFVQHLDPKHESLLTEILARSTTMSVTEVTEGIPVKANHVYIIPPNTNLGIGRGILHLMPRTTTRGQHMPVDIFLHSLAEDQKNKAIGVILSGTASDGVLGLKAIRAEGGITFAQDEKSAKYGGMPRSAASAGVVDFVLPPEGIARELVRIGRHPYLTSPKAEAPEELLPKTGTSLSKILALLRKAFSVDFTDYKDTTIRRRIKRRMVLHKLEEPETYLGYLHNHPAEVEALYHDILINVTSFLRDPEAFESLKTKAFPAIIKNRPPDAPIRVWVPGCATGEEVYSIAMCLFEFLEEKRLPSPMQIFGTDVSQSAIEKARAGTYLENISLDVPPDRLRRFFVKLDGGGYQVSKMLRDSCIFAQHDLIKDPPFSRVDLISCRNLLIYLGATLQKKILPMFHYALKSGGFLMLGSSETVGAFSHHFQLADKKGKIYEKKATSIRPHVGVPFLSEAADQVTGIEKQLGGPVKPDFDALKEADRIVQNNYSPPGVLINDDMEILQFRGRISAYLEPAAGAASFNLLKMAREGLLPELRAAIHQAEKQNVRVRKEGVRVKVNDHTKWTNLSIHPVRAPRGAGQFFLVLFEDVPSPSPERGEQRRPGSTAAKGKETRTERENKELQRELNTTKEYLQSIVEEQEATNEELKSANEEILSSNEELQSTNEELETAKEELQSSNEELTTLNEELQNRNLELTQVNNDLLNLLSNINIPVVMLAPNLRIRRFTPQAEKVLNLISSDIGRPITDIRLGIDVPNLEELIVNTIETMNVNHFEAQDKQGRWYSVWIRPYRAPDNKIDGALIALMDVDKLKTEIAEHERSKDELRRFKFISDYASDAFDMIDEDGRFQYVNRRACERLGYSEAELLQMNLWDIDPKLSKKKVHELFKRLERGEISPFEGLRRRKDGSTFPVEVSLTSVPVEDKHYIFARVRDISERKEREDVLREVHAELENRVGERTAELNRALEERQGLFMRLLRTQDEERRKLSRELHDTTGQNLVALKMNLSALERSLDSSDLKPKQTYLESLELTEQCIREVRTLSYVLHPPLLDERGLASALRLFIEGFSQRSGINVDLEIPDDVGRLDPEAELAGFRVVQESLTNVHRHSGTRTAQVRVERRDSRLTIEISAPGSGFRGSGPDAVRDAEARGIGIRGMRERVQQVGGQLEIESTSSSSVVRAVLPTMDKHS